MTGPLLGGGHEKPIQRGGLSNSLDSLPILGGGAWQERGVVFLRGVDIPMRTMLTYEELLFFFSEQLSCVLLKDIQF